VSVFITWACPLQHNICLGTCHACVPGYSTISLRSSVVGLLSSVFCLQSSAFSLQPSVFSLLPTRGDKISPRYNPAMSPHSARLTGWPDDIVLPPPPSAGRPGYRYLECQEISSCFRHLRSGRYAMPAMPKRRIPSDHTHMI
jgi:hypothetical protein